MSKFRGCHQLTVVCGADNKQKTRVTVARQAFTVCECGCMFACVAGDVLTVVLQINLVCQFLLHLFQ